MKFAEHVRFMRLALEQAAQAARLGEVPVGAVAVLGDQVIGVGHNRRERDCDPTAHAEIVALRQAAHHLGGWRLSEVTLYCTLEPCAMCAGALIQAHLKRVFWAADDAKAGAGGSTVNLFDMPGVLHHVETQRGLLAEEAAEQLAGFFRAVRGT